MSLSMKIFRWLLSHLTLIIVLSLILYFYWNRNDFWPEEAYEKAPVISNEINAITPEAVTVPLSSKPALISKDERQLTNEKSIVKHAIINNEGQKKPLYPSDIESAGTETDSFAGSANKLIAANLSQGQSENHNVDTHPVPAGFSERKKVYEQKLSLAGRVMENNSNEALQSAHTQDDTKELSAVSELKIAPQEIPEKIVPGNLQEKKLQEQIRARQKKLSNQMVSLMNITIEPSVAAMTQPDIDIEPVTPIIKTPEQRQLVLQARAAFEQGNFELAEEKYLQLMNQLPELPDVVGELADVYKSQQRQADYIAMNTNFVKRLVDHYRFEEAWRIVIETAKVDKEIANKQRRIINKKQQELE